MNKYKIDYNKYADIRWPYALYARCAWSWRWEFIKSCESKEEAVELFNKLNGLPVFL
jgi:hypothetical protein